MKALYILALLLVLVGCGAPTVDERLGADLEKHILEAHARQGRVTMSTVDVVKWDRAVVFAPYTPMQSMPASVRSDQRVRLSGIDARDDIALIVFFSSDALVGVVQMRRALLDLAPLAGVNLMPSDCIQTGSETPPKAVLLKGCVGH